MILVAACATTPRATVNQVIDFVYKWNGDILDVAQVFVTMQAFWKDNLLRSTGKIETTKGRRPSACFGITSEGKTAIKHWEEHHLRALAFGKLIHHAHKMTAKEIRQPRRDTKTAPVPEPASSGP
jgi:hypothetical protein